jgi:putative zinc-binding metallo-peptidase
LDDGALLEMRLCDLPLRFEGLLARRVQRLHRELEKRGIAAFPHTWLSEEFFTPDGVLGFAIPFYLAHPRLMRLERSQMLEVEGAAEVECRRIFRHEAGHCLDEAYGFYRRDGYRQLFGDASEEYPTSYKPKPDSRDYVINLAGWYAQGHPVEDFAETFAVWLNPSSDWRSDYQRWPLALRKLEYVDELMREIAGKPPLAANRREVEPTPCNSTTTRSAPTSLGSGRQTTTSTCAASFPTMHRRQTHFRPRASCAAGARNCAAALPRARVSMPTRWTSCCGR